MRTIVMISIFFALLLSASNSVHAWSRPHYEDAVIVERSELIVVAHLKEGSIQYVPHKKKAHEGSSWEHHAKLVIKDVLKGKNDKKEIPVIIHYGLTPVVRSSVKKENSTANSQAVRDDDSKDIIEIFDTGNSIRGKPSLVKNAGQDNIWFLRKRSGSYGRKPGTGKYGIVDPEDIQPLNWKDYFITYMSDDPESAVKEWSKKNPGRAGRAKIYLDHLEVQRIMKIKDSQERYTKLLPFFLDRMTWNMKFEAKEGIILCGKTAGEQLKKVFDDPERAGFRSEIIRMWRDIGYKEAVPLLVDLLKKHDRFWAKQNLPEGWWNKDVGSDRTRRRRDIYSEVYYSICALRTFKDRRAKSVIEKILNRWKAIKFENLQIVDECEAALRELSVD